MNQQNDLRTWRRSVALVLAVALPAGGAAARQADPDDAAVTLSALAELSLEQLGNVDVTSVSRRRQPIFEAAAAVFVITAEDIRRSGVTSLPEVLRLAPNLEVARLDSNQYAISARGFNTTTANKLLVLIDGRSVYTPLFSGVFWDAQDVLLPDVERIEVISGPGGTLWGSNAVNGVINIITKRAQDTQGTLARFLAGTEEVSGGVRHGGLMENGAWRAYAKYFDRGSTGLANGNSALDDWQSAQAGFRMDWTRAKDAFTVQGDVYDGTIDQPGLPDKKRDGGNLIGRWTRSLERDAEISLQLNLDRTRRDHPTVFGETRDVVEVDFQHRLATRGRHEILWGTGYRSSSDDVRNTEALAFLPAKRDLDRQHLFVQDGIALVPEKLRLTLGAKLERNDYTGFEVQPSVRLAWNVRPDQFVWAAVSRAVRTPSRIDRDLFIPGAVPFVLAGGRDFRSETLRAHEVGWRVQAPRASVTVAAFYNVYDHLRTVEPDAASGAVVIANLMEGDAYGVEAWADVRATNRWSLRPGWAFLEKDLELKPGGQNPGGTNSEGNDPRHRLVLGSLLSLPHAVELDARLRHVSALPSPAIPSYTTLDVRVGWKPTPRLALDFVAENLLEPRHAEFGSAAARREIERAAHVRATWSF